MPYLPADQRIFFFGLHLLSSASKLVLLSRNVCDKIRSDPGGFDRDRFARHWFERPFGKSAKPVWKRGDGTGPVIRSLEGEPLAGPRYWFEPALPKSRVRNFSWRCLRHTFASRLVMAGVDLRTVQELMGHKSIEMTVRYSHLTPKHTLAAVQRLTATDSTNSTGTRTSTGTSEQNRTEVERVQ